MQGLLALNDVSANTDGIFQVFYNIPDMWLRFNDFGKCTVFIEVHPLHGIAFQSILLHAFSSQHYGYLQVNSLWLECLRGETSFLVFGDSHVCIIGITKRTKGY
ncbi:hypothetical protein O9992_18475 [Vibrio lentus]|nr:hypothetical protein [Vibrio lentus]